MSPPTMASLQKSNYSPSSPASPTSVSNDSAIDSSSGSPPPEPSGNRRRKQVDKESDQYKARRERNNEAVRKSRAKSKQKRQQTDYQLRQLTSQNKDLQLKVEVLEKELLLIRSWVHMPNGDPQMMNGQGVVAPDLRAESP